MTDYLNELIEELVSYRYDPRGFVRWGFPWGEEGTELAERTNIFEPWQDRAIGHLQEVAEDWKRGIYEPARICVTSGHGIGKSAWVSWINLWALGTAEDTRGVLTAGTETQLKTKTWVELAKWKRLFLASELFDMTATALFPKGRKAAEEWRLDIVPWSEHNAEAFAGMHNLGKRVIITFDESSGIPAIIHETAAGVDTDRDTEIIRIQTGNATDPNCYFRECSSGGKFESLWWGLKVDSRDVSLTNKEVIAQEIAIHGEDSDYIRVRRRGEFPKQSFDSFISRAAVEKAQKRPPPEDNPAPVVLGVDIGRKNDPTVCFWRKGLDASLEPAILHDGTTVERITMFILQQVAMHDPETVFIDIGSFGWAIYDILVSKNMSRPMFYPVDFGAGADGLTTQNSRAKYANKRAEIWGNIKDWLARGSLYNDDGLREELIAPTYKFQRETVIQLESKESIKTRLGRSTDKADALACTFAQIADVHIAIPQEDALFARHPHLMEKPTDYSPFSEENIYAGF